MILVIYPLRPLSFDYAEDEGELCRIIIFIVSRLVKVNCKTQLKINTDLCTRLIKYYIIYSYPPPERSRRKGIGAKHQTQNRSIYADY
jgi:hypothetical protein